MNVTIHGPNLNDQSKGQFHVHTADCADNAREVKLNGSVLPWTIEATSREEVVRALYSDPIAEAEAENDWARRALAGDDPDDAAEAKRLGLPREIDWQSYDDLHVAPCVHFPNPKTSPKGPAMPSTKTTATKTAAKTGAKKTAAKKAPAKTTAKKTTATRGAKPDAATLDLKLAKSTRAIKATVAGLPEGDVRWSVKNRQTGTTVGLVAASAESFGAPESVKVHAVCVDHGAVCGFATARIASAWRAYPADWCPSCREAAQAPAAEKVVAAKPESKTAKAKRERAERADAKIAAELKDVDIEAAVQAATEAAATA